jgi:heme oxygenase
LLRFDQETHLTSGDFRVDLHAATAPHHREIDALFGRFDLTQRQGLTRFLAAHAIGMRACQPVIARFGETALGCAPPDYAGILARDLAALGVAAAQLPIANLPGDICGESSGAGVFYVVAGSRMGAAVLRNQATAMTPRGPAHTACGYFAQGEGPAVWRLFRLWLSQQSEHAAAGRAAVDLPGMIGAAKAAFQLFADAADLAAGLDVGFAERRFGDAA